jgi:hypothetical protein
MKTKRVMVIGHIVVIALTGIGCSDDSTGPSGPPAGPQTWALSAGGLSNDRGLGMATDAVGNVIVTGDFVGTATFGGTTIASVGGADIFVAKYTPGGSLIWVTSAGGANNDAGWGVATDAVGNVLVVGYFTSAADFNGTRLTSLGGDDIFVAKYDPSGDLLWVTSAGGTSIDRARGIATDATGNVIVAGYFNGSATFDSTPVTGAGDNDAFVAKYDAAGNFQWVRSAGGIGDDQAWRCGVDGSGNIVVTGRFTLTASFGSTQVTSAGMRDIFVAKYNANNGAVLWVQSAGGPGEDQGWDLATHGSDVVVTGSYSGTATFGSTDLTSFGNLDVFVAKYNIAGLQLWVQSGGGGGDDEGLSVATDGAGHVIATGFFFNAADFGSTTIRGEGQGDVFLIKYDGPGNLLWAQSAGGESLDVGFDIGTDGSNNILGTGSFQDTATFGSATLVTAGVDDAFIIKTGPNGLQ